MSKAESEYRAQKEGELIDMINRLSAEQLAFVISPPIGAPPLPIHTTDPIVRR